MRNLCVGERERDRERPRETERERDICWAVCSFYNNHCKSELSPLRTIHTTERKHTLISICSSISLFLMVVYSFSSLERKNRDWWCDVTKLKKRKERKEITKILSDVSLSLLTNIQSIILTPNTTRRQGALLWKLPVQTEIKKDFSYFRMNQVNLVEATSAC